MLYEFKSRATGSVLMLAPVAERLLGIIGKSAGPRGVIPVEELGPAIAALQAAVEQARQAQAESGPETGSGTGPRTRGGSGSDDDGPSDDGQAVSLAQRAFALIEMFSLAQKAGKPVTWGI